MSSPCDPAHAPVGDVGAAIMMIDSRLITDALSVADGDQED
ncbi:hypothetical protein [Streptomyces sp. NPDC050528]